MSEGCGPFPPTPGTSRAPSASARPRWLLWLAGLGLAGATVWAVWGTLAPLWHPTRTLTTGRHAAAGPPDPRLLYSGPFHNIHPDIAYVGDAECAVCHAEICASFARHPMGRALALVTPTNDEPVAAANNPFQILETRFLVEHHSGKVRHLQTRRDAANREIFTFADEVHYAIGSGTHGHSYLTNRDGYLFETPISWFAHKSKWDLSPGFQAEHLAGRPVGGECLFCHANRAHFRENSVNHFDAPFLTGHAIGCERCHGPGSLHARTIRADDIVDPRRLNPVLRDAVCEQCHLEGEARILRRGRRLYDFRPGLPLEQFWAIFVADHSANEGRKAVTHVEQMHESRCYQGSSGAGKLGCVSCHDPHVHLEPGEPRDAFYKDRCLACHKEHGCSLPAAVRLCRSPLDSCVDCHMPRFDLADIAHTAGSDHTIPRRRNLRAAGPGERSLAGVLVPFHPRPAADMDLGRDLAVAIRNLSPDARSAPRGALARLLSLLETALRNDPQDLPAREAKGTVLMLLDRYAEALAAFQTILDRDPDHERGLVGAAQAALALGQAGQALGYWRKAVATNPSLARYRQSLTDLLVRSGEWEEARKECRSWLALDPGSVQARKAWITCLLQEGNKQEAVRVFDEIEALQPSNVQQLRDWFRAHAAP